jgi:hypothetical protein
MDDLSRQSLRLYQRYQLEIVEALNLCPWAKRAREEGKVDIEVCDLIAPDVEVVLDRVAALAANPIDIGLLLFPRLELGRLEFERFVADLIARDAERRTLSSPPFAFAAFHPAASADLSKPERLIPFWRRSPDPTLQLVRLSALERVRRADPPGTQFIDPAKIDFSKPLPPPSLSLRQKISKANRDTLEAAGLEAISARFDSIQKDRRSTRQALGLAPSPWDVPCA